MNIPERQGENCCDIIINDIIENELKISTQDIRFYAASAQNGDNSTTTCPRPIIAQFVSSDMSKFWALKIVSRNPTDTKMRTKPITTLE